MFIFIHSLSQQSLLWTCCVPVTFLSTGDKMMNKTIQVPALIHLIFHGGVWMGEENKIVMQTIEYSG